MRNRRRFADVEFISASCTDEKPPANRQLADGHPLKGIGVNLRVVL